MNNDIQNRLQAAIAAIFEHACQVEAAKRRETCHVIGQETLAWAQRIEPTLSDAPGQAKAVLLPAIESIKTACRRLL